MGFAALNPSYGLPEGRMAPREATGARIFQWQFLFVLCFTTASRSLRPPKNSEFSAIYFCTSSFLEVAVT